MRKVFELNEQFATGEDTVQLIALPGLTGLPVYDRRVKTASEAVEFCKTVEPKPGMSIVLVLALGAYETYDLNRNGDGFNEFAYKPGFKPTCGCCHADDGWVSQSEVLPQHYKSFEQYGKVYRHHVNKDPLKSYGDVLRAFWNPTMHRVELLIALDNAKAPDLAERIEAKEYPAVSMGCRIKYDVCTICGHRAPTRAQYCEHLKFGMRQVTPSGLRAGALNPSPRFFDISFVIKPADQTGYMLKKVAEHDSYEIRTAASMGEYLEFVDEKRAAIQKISDIDKVVRGLVVDHTTSPLSSFDADSIRKYQQQIMPAVRAMPLMDDETLNGLAKFPISETLSTLHASSAVPTTHELTRLLLARMLPGTQLPPHIVDTMVALQGQMMDLYAQHPQLLDQVIGEGGLEISSKKVNPEIKGIASKYLEKRATIGDYLSRKLIPNSMRPEEPPYTDTMHIADPRTGDRYVTNRGAAIAAHDEIAKKQLAKVVGGALGLTAAHKIVASGLPKALRPVSAATAMLAGTQLLRPDYGTTYMTEEGVTVPSITEMRKMSSDLMSTALPILGVGGLVTALSHDYESRLRKGYYNPYAPLHEQLVNRLGQYAYEHPALSLLGGLSAYGSGKHMLSKLGSLTEVPTDSVLLPTLDFDFVAEKIGNFILG